MRNHPVQVRDGALPVPAGQSTATTQLRVSVWRRSKPRTRLESGLLQAKTWRCTVFPPLAILATRTKDEATPPVPGGTRRRLKNTETAKIGSRNVLTES